MKIITVTFELPTLISELFASDLPGSIRIDTEEKQKLLIKCLATLQAQNLEDNEILNSF